MKFIKPVLWINIGMLLYCCVMLSSCLKTKDSTSDGPKSKVAITNYAVNGSINVLYDNTVLTTAPLAFGAGLASGTPGGYMDLGAGLHNLQINSTSNAALIDKTLSMTAGLNYSLYIYDTIQNSKVKKLLLTDDLTAIDTVGRARFIQFIPEADSLTLTLKRDSTYTFADGYAGNKAEVSALEFSHYLRPGSYLVTLQRKGTTIFTQAAFTITAGKLYSFISRGTVNGTGDYKETVSVVQHN